MMRRNFVVIFLFFLVSCTAANNPKTTKINREVPHIVAFDDEIIKTSYKAAEYLDSRLKLLDNSFEKKIIVTTFPNNDDIEKTNSIGRLVPHFIASRLAQLGYKPVELRVREKDILVKKRLGEIILSRDYKKIKNNLGATFVLTGHYTVLNKKFYIHSEIVSLIDQTIVASYDFVISTGELMPSVITNKELLDHRL